MIGFLCNSKDIVKYSMIFYDRLRAIIERHVSIGLFTINDVDFINKKIFAVVISEKGVENSEFNIPKIIFNLSIQHKRENIKKLRRLSNIENIQLMNAVNRFNQLMIMDILSAYDLTQKYTLPYCKYDEEEVNEFLKNHNWLLIIPKYGTKISRMIYIEQSEFYLKGKKEEWAPNYRKKNKQNKFVTTNKHRILVKCPQLLSYDNHLLITRTYLQKSVNGAWKLLSVSINPKGSVINEEISNDLKSIALLNVNYINHFIPSLEMCFIDFVFDIDKKPYFLHLGGWDRKLLNSKADNRIYNNFCENLIKCYQDYGNKSQEEQ